ncbi:hypothetical protein [Bacillus cereus]|uniref:hypothetical protein n=1 Tax=Bacillus cereus TaxID=1396 RepID=UPI000BFCBF19|nr:hypothetical protein [Bacillus cereus]PGY13296.1 hypothetical protein COE23_15705 [Bacillus cereus]WJE28007.1 hypothetical protein QRE65_14895 [Bacillus cereus]
MSKTYKKNNWLYIFSILIFIILEPYTYISMYKVPKVSFVIITGILLVGYIGKVLNNKEDIKISGKKFIVALALMGILLLNKLITNDPSYFYFFLAMTICLAYFISELYNFEKFLEAYSKVMAFLCMFSLITTYAIIFFPTPFMGIFPTIEHNPGNYIMKFIDVGLSFVYIPDYGMQYRNYSIFREPGVFQFYINLALIFELWFKNEKIKKSRLVVYYITLISTFSTTGLIIGLVILFTYIVTNTQSNSNKIRFIIGISIFLLIFTVMYYKIPFIQENFDGAFDKFNGGESSTARTASLIAYLVAWLNKPIIGWGYTGGVYEAGNLYLHEYTQDNTNTIVTNFAFFGLIYGLIYQLLLVKFVNLSKQTLVIRIVMFIVLMLAINSQKFIDSMLIFTLLFYAIDKKRGIGV